MDWIGPAVVAAVVSGIVSYGALIKKLDSERKLAERRFEYDKDLAERRFSYERDLHDHGRRIELAEQPLPLSMRRRARSVLPSSRLASM
jgi:hypothetical protein